jgi:hypothetical protein
MKKINLPPDVAFHQDIRLLVYRPRGLIDEAAINAIIAVVEQLEIEKWRPFNRFYDMSEATKVDLNIKYVTDASIHRRLSHRGRKSVKSAILAKDWDLVHYGHLFELLTQGSSIKVRVFQDRNDAAKWLEVKGWCLKPKAPKQIMKAKVAGYV